MRRCANCSTAVEEDGQRFCPGCGNPLPPAIGGDIGLAAAPGPVASSPVPSSTPETAAGGFDPRDVRREIAGEVSGARRGAEEFARAGGFPQGSPSSAPAAEARAAAPPCFPSTDAPGAPPTAAGEAEAAAAYARMIGDGRIAAADRKRIMGWMSKGFLLKMEEDFYDDLLSSREAGRLAGLFVDLFRNRVVEGDMGGFELRIQDRTDRRLKKGRATLVLGDAEGGRNAAPPQDFGLRPGSHSVVRLSRKWAEAGEHAFRLEFRCWDLDGRVQVFQSPDASFHVCRAGTQNLHIEIRKDYHVEGGGVFSGGMGGLGDKLELPTGAAEVPDAYYLVPETLELCEEESAATCSGAPADLVAAFEGFPAGDAPAGARPFPEETALKFGRNSTRAHEKNPNPHDACLRFYRPDGALMANESSWVSSVQFEVVHKGGEVLVVSRGSRGTWMNGSRLPDGRPVALHDGDEISALEPGVVPSMTVRVRWRSRDGRLEEVRFVKA
jgi:hypothetical protein